jgi:two-component system NtrC family sensor kinase
MFSALYSISLRRKVIIGAALVYLFMTATILGSYYSMRSLEDKISYLENVSKLEESVLEIRRFEKNYFLYGNKDSLTTALYHLKRVEALVTDNTAKMESLSSPHQIAEFKASLREYGQLLGQCSSSSGKDTNGKSDCEGSMRRAGNAMAQFGESVAKRKRDSIKETMRATVTLPLFGLIVVGCGLVAIGSFLFTKVTRSLLLLEDGTTRIAQGAFKPIETLPAERDIRNILIAFNSMALQLQDREEQLVQSKKLASLGTMLAGVAHEVNNPLSNISSACEILLEELDEANKEFQCKFLRSILVQVEKARTLILNLLEFSRTKELHLESVSLKGMIERTLESLSGEKPADLRVTVQIDPTIRVHVDRGKMEQAFTNLISNAFQAMDGDGEVKIRALAKRDGIVKVRVSDSGKGIPEENLPKIFDPFFTTKDVGKGTGLGLFITHDIILRHKGTIQVKSSPEKGTTFTIHLPVENS